MHYYLAAWSGLGTEEAPFVPLGADLLTGWQAIDLRPDPTVVDGRCVLRSPVALPTAPGRLYLGDDLDVLSATVRRAIENRLGVALDGEGRLRQAITRLLVEHGDDARRDRWNRLRPAGNRYEVWLGELIDAMPVVRGGSSQTDSFDRSDSTNISTGAPFSWTELTGDQQINTNRLVNADNLAVASYSRAEVDLSTVDHYVEGALHLITTANGQAGVCGRFSSSATTCYRASTRQDGAAYSLHRVVAGVLTTILAGSTTTPNTKVLRLTCSGSTISSTLDGAELQSITDVVITTGTRFGVITSNQGGANRQGLYSIHAEDVVTSVARSLGISAGVSIPSTGAVAYGASF